MSDSAAPHKIFLNYSTVSPMCEPAYRASRQFLEDFYRVGPPEVLYQYEPLADALAEEAAQLLNCDTSEITYTKNTTEGVIIAASALPLDPGDEVVLQAGEYPANRLPWLKLRHDGVSVNVITAASSPEAFEALLAAIGPRTRVVAISSAQHYDGYMADLDRVAALCQQRGIYLVVDAAQTTGIRALNLQSTPIDILVCGGQKYLQAGMGIGFMYVNKDIMPHLRHTKVGSRSMSTFNHDSYNLKPGAARFQDGTQNLQGIVALHAALKHVNQRGIERIERRSQELLADIKSCLAEHNLPFIDHGGHQSNIVSLRVPDPVALAKYLASRQIYIKPVNDVARLSFSVDTLIEDVCTLAEVTARWLRR